jgi:LysR family transcriptional regulator, hca operon transcriptional activator
MDLRYLRYFIVVAEELNFTRAAERLHTVQPSLSSQIRRLEEIVGTRLLNRTRHSVELTPAGKTFLDEARKIVADIERAIERTIRSSQATVGELSIGFVSGLEGVVVPHIMLQMQRMYPDIQFHLISSTDTELIAALQRQVIDLVFCAPIDDSKLLQEIANELVFQMELVAIYPAEYGFPNLKRIPVSLLADKPFIQPMMGKYIHADKSIKEITSQSGVIFRTGSYADGALASVNAVSSGLGFSFVPDFMTRNLPPSVIARPLDILHPPQSPIVAAYRKDNTLPALKLFLGFLRNYIKEHGLEISSFKEKTQTR